MPLAEGLPVSERYRNDYINTDNTESESYPDAKQHDHNSIPYLGLSPWKLSGVNQDLSVIHILIR